MKLFRLFQSTQFTVLAGRLPILDTATKGQRAFIYTKTLQLTILPQKVLESPLYLLTVSENKFSVALKLN